MTVRILSDVEKREIAYEYSKGATKAELAGDYAVSRKTISRVLIEMKMISPNWRSEIHLNEEEAKLIREIRLDRYKPSNMVNIDSLTTVDIFKWFRRQATDRQNLIAKLIYAEIQRRSSKVA